MTLINVKKQTWLLIFIIAIAMPTYATIDVGGIRLNFLRIFLLLAFFPTVLSYRNINFIDFLIVFFSIWTVICTLYNYGFDVGITKSGFLFLESAIVFLFGRSFITSVKNFTIMVKYLVLSALILSILSIPESLLHSRYLVNISTAILGTPYLGQDDIRYGLMRAQTTFSHQILFGLYCSLGVILANTVIFFKNNFTRLLVTLALVVGCVMSVSSTAQMALFITLGAILIERFSRQLEKRTTYISIAILSFVIYSQLFVGGGVFGIINRYLAFSSTGYYRIEIWNWGWINIWNSPFFGMVGEQWLRWPWMGESIDNFYIKVGIYFGLVGMIILFAAVMISIISAIQLNKRIQNPQLRMIIFGWWLSLLIFSIAAISVDLFGQAYALFFFWLGAGQGLISAARKQFTSLTSNSTSVQLLA